MTPRFTSPPQSLRYNRLTLYAKFILDTLRGKSKFILHGKRINKTSRLTAVKPETIWFPTTFFLDRGLAWQTTIGRALEVRGHQVVFSHFDIAWPRRNGLYFDLQDAGFIMAYYRLYTKTLLSGFGFTHRPMSEFGNADNFNSYRQQVAMFTRAECEAFTYKDFPIGNYARNPLIHYFRCSPATDEPEILAAWRDYLAIGMVMVDTFARAFDQVRPTIVMLLNGSFLDSRLQLEMARRRNIRVITFEAGFMLNALMLGINEPIISFPMGKYLPVAYTDYQIHEDQNKQLSKYLDSRRHGKETVFDYWQTPIFDDRAIRTELGLAAGVKPDILFTNLLWDSAMLDCDLAFTDQLSWITKTIQWYIDHPARTLLIRIHPAEINPPQLASMDRLGEAIKLSFPRLPANIIVIAPTSQISSYPLTELSNLNLVYSSTAGLEAAIMGKPTIIAGKTHYRGQGFTHDIENNDQYFKLLANPRLPADQTEVVQQAKKYAYFFFFGFNIPFPLVREQATNEPGPAVAFAFTDEAALSPGRDRSLDFVIDVILGQTDYRPRLSELIL